MKSTVSSILLLICTAVFAQHEHHAHKRADSTGHSENGIEMPHAYSRSLPMTRNGSGTGWMPDASVMYGHGIHLRKWMFMAHANLFIRYNKQDVFNVGTRGGEKFDAPNWLMFMGQRNVGKSGLFSFGVMLSGDPFTIGSSGYPLLFQSGETYKGARLVDRQHPHDLFSGLSVAYTHMFSKNLDLTAYVGYPGEPALGPVAFMHRTSALNNPDAPLSHHWQDATHISFGVASLGLRYKKFKLEASSFTGREPNEIRTDFDKPRFDSYSFRLMYSPTRQLVLQASQAYLISPEELDPFQNVRRTTASAIHHLPFKEKNKYLASTLAWGINSSDHTENSFLLETNLQLDRTAIYGRYEWIQKSADELNLQQFNNGHEAVFSLQALTIGASYTFLRKYGNNLAIGAQGSVFVPDHRLIPLYGKTPVSFEVYLRLSPHLMHMHSKR